jgi:2-dehydropantoate 2-reductase
MNILVVGAGAMGSLFAGLLTEAGHSVTLFEAIGERVSAIRKEGIQIEKDGRTRSAAPAMVTGDSSALGETDCVILFVKAFDTAQAIHDIAPVLTDDTTVVTLQNGLGNIEQIHERVREDRIVAGTTAHGATLIGPGRIRHAGEGESVIGPVCEQGAAAAESIASLLKSAGIATSVHPDIHSVLWGKLLINVGINPLTAIMRIKNGQILDFPTLREVMHDAVRECAAVADKKGISIPYADPVEKVESVCRATAGNISSMHQDILAGRKTEIDYINGAVIRHGEDAGCPTPVNHVLAGLVKTLERLNMA